MAAIRARSGSEERSWGDRVRVAKAEREEGSLPVMVDDDWLLVVVAAVLPILVGCASRKYGGCGEIDCTVELNYKYASLIND